MPALPVVNGGRNARRPSLGHLVSDRANISAPPSGSGAVCLIRLDPAVGTFAVMTRNDLEQSSSGRGESVAGVDLYWLPLGAGGHSVRLNGRVFEAAVSRLEHRPACDLYHSALEVRVPEGRFVIEQAPVRDGEGARRGVAVGGAVGARWAGRFRIFSYEVRRWRDGVIPDVGEAVDSSGNDGSARRGQRSTPGRSTGWADCQARLPASHVKGGSRDLYYARSTGHRDSAFAACVLRGFGVRGLVGVDVPVRRRWRRGEEGCGLADSFPGASRPGPRSGCGDGAGLGSYRSSRPSRADGPLASCPAGVTSAARAVCRRSASFLCA
jgi:hypothetical protein